MTRLFTLAAVLLAVAICTSNLADGKRARFDRRDDVALEKAEILGEAGIALASVPLADLGPFTKAVVACVKTGNKGHGKQLVAKSMALLSALGNQGRRHVHWSRRDNSQKVDADVMKLLQEGARILTLLDSEQINEYQKLYLNLVGATQEQRIDYVKQLTVAAQQCADGKDITRRNYHLGRFMEDSEDESDE